MTMTLDDARTVLKTLASAALRGSALDVCPWCDTRTPGHSPECQSEAARLVLAALEEAEKQLGARRQRRMPNPYDLNAQPPRQTESRVRPGSPYDLSVGKKGFQR